ncbi:MAG: PilZ domain-containing protein [Myxococcaceae bacterium]|nr:PilZ domain-containing protein [Myxococcaceae bacterium]
MMRSVKRRWGRAPIHVSAQCTLQQGRVDGTVWQIGEGGLFVELPTLEALPETLAVSFELPGFGQHRVVAHPVWLTEKPPRAVPCAARGAGCEFSDVSNTTRKAVAEYVKKMKATYSSLQFALALDRPTPQLPALLRETELDRIRDRKELKERVATMVAQMQSVS